MLLGKFFRQERVAKRAWELNVKDPACVHVSYFCTTETELASTKPMWMNRHLVPRRDSRFKRLQMVHALRASTLCFRC
jgi:hypothetical protein